MISSFRQTAVDRARQLWGTNPLFLDTETTGLSEKAEIVEICIIDYDRTVLLDTLVRPRYPIPADATRIHGITNQMVSSAKTWMHIWPEVEKILSGRSLGIYNAEYDLRLMRQSHQQIGLPWRSLDVRSFCIMTLYSDFSGASKWQRLEVAGRKLGIPLPNSHRAKDDTVLAREVFLSMVNYQG